MAKISLSLEQVSTIVTKINQASEKIATNWNSIKNDDLTKIRNSWAGSDCEAYITKVEEMNSDMQKAIQALNLLSQTFLKVQQSVSETQNKIKSAVSGL